MLRPLAFIFAGTVAKAYVSQSSFKSYSDEANTKQGDKVPASPSIKVSPTKPIEDTDEDDEEWLKSKEECPFCKHFLESPCAHQFKKWSKCVDKCKADDTDFVQVCEEFTKHLLDCTAANVEYFKVLGGDEGDEVRDDESEDSSNATDTSADTKIEIDPKEEKKVE